VAGRARADWADVARCATALPEVTEGPGRQWHVHGKPFVLERPLRRADLAYLGERAPAEPPLGAWVPDLGVKEALLGSQPAVYFTTPHFDGYPMVLARLDRLDPVELGELVVDAWLTRAPRTLARRWLEEHPDLDRT
jgi:hypothetical protein